MIDPVFGLAVPKGRRCRLIHRYITGSYSDKPRSRWHIAFGARFLSASPPAGIDLDYRPLMALRRKKIITLDRSELAAALASCRGAFFATALLSGMSNVLMLTGAMFMLEIYDRVLPSRSVPTL